MATVSGGPETAPASPGWRASEDVELVQYERYIDSQLRKTRLQVKGVELTTALITLAVGSLVYLFVVALIDHWVVKGGLGFAGRLVFLLAFLAGAGAYFGLVLWPLLVRRINPVYAAQAIERSRPSLKNSLINFLLLRTRPGGMSPMVYEAIERQAADGLSQVSVESAVDRSRMLKVGWALLAIVALCAIYTVVSPKNPLRSFGRVVAPWADIAAPTRVRIAEVTPGNERAFHDQFVTVSAEVSGVADGEPVTLFYSTADGQLVDQSVSMALPPGGLRYTAELPPTSGGLQQDLEYYLVAGDAVTKRYGIHVLITPSILVRSVDYQFPQYTEIDPRIADRQGDLKGIEGTRVTIHAEANDDIKSAYVDFDCDGRSDVAMHVEGRKAHATFALGLKPKSNEPEHASYQLRFQNFDGEENPRPIRHQIEVVKDLAPQIVFVEPIEAATQPVRAEAAGADRAADKNLGNKGVALKRGNKNLAGKNPADRIAPANPIALDPGALDPGARASAEPAEQQLPQGGFMRMAVDASDPDFKLGSVKLMAQRNGQPLLSKELLAAPSAGPFHGAFFFNSNDLKLVAGDTVVYWAVAEDNKQPDPNKTETQRFTLRITSPEQQQPKQDQVANADSKQQPPKPNDRNPNPKNQDPKNQPQQGEQPKQEKGQKGEGKPGEGGGQDKTGAQQQREEQQREEQQREEQQREEQQREEQQREEQRREEQPQENQPGEGQPGEGKAGEQKSGEQKPDQKNPDEKNAERKNTENQSGESNDGGEASAGEGQPGKGKSGDRKSSGGKAGEKKSGQASKQDQASGQDERPVDPDAQPGDAFQKILNRANQERQKDRGEKPANQSPDDPMKGDRNPDQKPGEQGDDPSTEKKPPEQKPDEQPQGGDAKGNESTGGKGQSKGSEAKGGEKSSPSGDKPAGSKPDSKSGSPAGDKTGEQKPDGDPSGEKSGSGVAGKSEQPKGAQPTDKKTPGEKPQGSDAGGSPSADKGEAKGAEKGTQKGAEKDAEKGTDKGAGKAGDKPAGDRSATDDASGQPGMPMPGEPKTGEPKSGEPKAGDAKAGDPKSGDPKAGEPKAGDPKNGDPKSGQPKPGHGGKSGDEQPNEKQQKQPQAGAKPGDEKGGDAEAKSKGPSGAGEKGGNPKGSPSSQEEGATPREKKQQPSGAGKPNSEDKPESPGISKKESDSKGGEEGDREGGGGKGGGQRSNSQGTGSAGKNTESNEGGGVANTPGKGETGEKGGDQAKGKSADGAGKSTGKPGDGNKTRPGGEKPGAGDDGKPGETKPGEKGSPGEKKSPGEKPGEGQTPPQSPNDGSPKAGDQPQREPGKAGDQPQSPSKAGDSKGDNSKQGNKDLGNKDPGGSAGNPTGGGGLPPDQVAPPGGKAAPNEEGEDPNLEYSRKATDLALEYLKDQMNKENPDKKLLEDLKWSREDAARFVAKWEKMKRDAQAAGPQGEAARKQLDGALDGLGLRPRGASLRGGQTSETRTPTVRDTRRSEPPPEYRQQFRAFTKGVAKGEEAAKPASK